MTASLTDLLSESRQLGFLGPGPVEAHISHAAAFPSAVNEIPARALDLGAGGGLPGLVLAATIWPGTTWTFLDAQLRRTDFLARASGALGLLDRVQVVNGRAEEVGRDLAHRAGYDLVVARSFAAPAVVAECAAPLLRVGGWLVVSEPPDTPLAARWPAHGLALVGLGPVEAVEAVDDAGEPIHLVRAQLVTLPDHRFPRRVGVPSKRPIF